MLFFKNYSFGIPEDPVFSTRCNLCFFSMVTPGTIYSRKYQRKKRKKKLMLHRLIKTGSSGSCMKKKFRSNYFHAPNIFG